MPPDAKFYRLKDSAATYYGGKRNLEASSVDNICDTDVYPLPHAPLFLNSRPSRAPSIPLAKIFGSMARDSDRNIISSKHSHRRLASCGYLQRGQTGPCN